MRQQRCRERQAGEHDDQRARNIAGPDSEPLEQGKRQQQGEEQAEDRQARAHRGTQHADIRFRRPQACHPPSILAEWVSQ